MGQQFGSFTGSCWCGGFGAPASDEQGLQDDVGHDKGDNHSVNPLTEAVAATAATAREAAVSGNGEAANELVVRMSKTSSVGVQSLSSEASWTRQNSDDKMDSIESPWKSLLKECGLDPRRLSDKLSLFDVNLLEEPESTTNIGCYYQLCMRQELMVTISCFAMWNKHGKANGHAKVIPAVPTVWPTGVAPSMMPRSSKPRMSMVEEEGAKDGLNGGKQANGAAGKESVKRSGAIRVFFFDDNLNFDEGCAESPGICNLRSVVTGEFVEFAEGKNGFRRSFEAKHTVVHFSSEYQVVLVQANILDAMEDKAYFTNILSKYSIPGEKLLAFMDVNSTIVCVDTVTDKSLGEILLSTMFEFIELRPPKGVPCEIVWEGRNPVKVPKSMTLKALVKKVAKDDKEYYRTFYELSRCEAFLSFVLKSGELYWASRADRPLSVSLFTQQFEEYLNSVADGATETGIVKSWFDCYNFLMKGQHSVVINSFGIDTRKVVGQTVEDVDIMHITVNHKLWDPQDQRKFEEEYGVTCRRKSTVVCTDEHAAQMRKLVRRNTFSKT